MSDVIMSSPSASAPTPGSFGLLLVLLCLTGFAVTEPLLSILGANPGIFAFYNVESFSHLALFALIVALVPAVALWALVKATQRINLRAANSLLQILIVVIVGLWFIQIVKWQLGLTGTATTILLGLIAGAAVAFAYSRWPLVRSWMRIAAIAPVFVVCVFLFASETSGLWIETQERSLQAEQSDKGHHPSVLFVLLDEFPTAALLDENSEIDTLRYPHIAALAAQATWYRRYTVLADLTMLSVPSLLSGQLPVKGPAISDRYPTNLFALLAPTHHLTAFETVSRLCSYAGCGEGPPGTDIRRVQPRLAGLIARSKDLWLQRINPGPVVEVKLDDFQETLIKSTPVPSKKSKNVLELLFTPEKLVGYTQAKPERLQRLRDTFAADAESALYFIHLELPHLPWRFYPDGTLYEAPVKKLAITHSTNVTSTWMAKVAEYRFTMQAQYTDQLLGELFTRLQELGVWDDMLVVVTADHGRAFQPNTSARAFKRATLGSIAYAPLLIKAPKQQVGRIDNSNLMAHDLLPTVANELGIDLPWQVAGLPAGHPAIDERGDEKFCYPRLDEAGIKPALGEKLVFSDKEAFPAYESRWIAAQSASGDNLALLNETLNLEHYMGRSPADFAIEPGGQASVEELQRLKSPGDSQPMGMVMGALKFEPVGDKVLIALNGRFVTASPLFEFKENRHTFLAMLPNAVLAATNQIDVYLVGEGTLARLDLF